MKRLQTHFALYSLLIAILAMALIVGPAILLDGADTRIILLILPIAVPVLIIGLAIGHYLSEPLKALAAHIANYRQTGTFGVPAESTLYTEVNDLSDEFRELADDTERRLKNLTLLERNQSVFLSNAAHEIRTPLTSIRSNAEMLADPDLPPELHERFCNNIINEAERLSRLTTDLISLQKANEEKPTISWHRVNLRDVAQDAVDSMAPLLHERQANVSIEGEAPDVLGNHDRLQEVVFNLVDNANHFIEPGGHIIIQLAGTEESSVISVMDDGTGFGDIDTQLLFERFYRSDFSRTRNAGGSGLGLAIVKSIVEAHDGSVDAYNRPEGGACFVIAIPSIKAT